MLNQVWRSLPLALGLTIAWPVGAATHLGVCSLNGVFLQSDIEVGYAGVGSTVVADFKSDSNTGQLPPVLGPAILVDAAASKIPAGGGDLKDMVEGTMTSSFEYGQPLGSTPFDTLAFLVKGDGSALNALNDALNPADATVTASAFIEFFVDIMPGMDCDGFIQLQGLRNLLLFETILEIKVTEDLGTPMATVIATLTPGSPDQLISVAEGHAYRVELDYNYVVPQGVDPPFEFRYSATVSTEPIPSPAPALPPWMLGLLALLLVGVTVGVVRRKKAIA